MKTIKFPAMPRDCRACRVPLKPSEHGVCAQCSAGSDFFDAAVAYLQTQPKRRPAWRRWTR